MHDPDGDLPLRGTRHLPADGGARGARRRQEGPVGSGAQRAPGEPLPRRADARTRPRSRSTPASSCRPAESAQRQRQEAADRPPVLPDRQLAAGLPDYAARARRRQRHPRADARAAERLHHDARVTLVSKDINLRIKAAIVGVHAEDYYSDRTIEDADLLYTGRQRRCRRTSGSRTARTSSRGRSTAARFYRVRGPLVTELARQPVRVRARRTTASRRSCARIDGDERDARAGAATTAASGTASGASPRATASRTSRSTCCWIRRSTSSPSSARPAPARRC